MTQIKKESGYLQEYDERKLTKSLAFTGANPEQINQIIKEVNKEIYEGITTRKIFSLAFKKLREISHPLSAYYGTKRALLELGPDGFIFEKFIAKLYEKLGHKTVTNVVISGHCIEHEVDVIAENSKEKVLVECKYHGSREKRNDLKVALYIQARSFDIKEGPYGKKYDHFCFVSNTSFSDDAIRYSTCAGLRLWGSNFPPQNTLQDIIRKYHIDPITCLASLKKVEKRMLLDSDILVTEDIIRSPNVLGDIGVSENRVKRVLHEISKL